MAPNPRTIGLLGGMSWESSIEYERILNEEIRRRLGGVHSADLLIRSYDFDRIERLQANGDWDAAGQLLARDAAALERAGAGLIVLCTNTMHVVADTIQAALSVPFLHLADATASEVLRTKDHDGLPLRRVGLLGTRYTMEKAFYRDRLSSHGLEVLVPEEGDRTIVHNIIFDELVQGIVSQQSKQRYLEVIDRLLADGAQAIIAGCTEIELLIAQEDLAVPLFATTRLHALAAAEWSLGTA